MRYLVLLLLLLPGLSGASSLLHQYAKDYNNGDPVSVYFKPVRDYWEASGRRGKLRLFDIKCNLNKCLSGYVLTDRGKVRDEGWLLCEERDGRLVTMLDNHGAPTFSWGPEAGQLADSATTAVGVGLLGFVEANPLGAGGAGAAKVLGISDLRSGSLKHCMANASWYKQLGYGAATWNGGLVGFALMDPEPVSKAVLGVLAAGAVAVAAGTKMTEDEKFWTCARYAMETELQDVTKSHFIY